MAKPEAQETYPFGETPICYKLHGKIFAQLFHTWPSPILTLKCRRDMSFFYRSIYPEKVVRAYHVPEMQQPYWYTVRLKDFPEDELMRMIDEAYDALSSSLHKKNRAK